MHLSFASSGSLHLINQWYEYNRVGLERNDSPHVAYGVASLAGEIMC